MHTCTLYIAHTNHSQLKTKLPIVKLSTFFFTEQQAVMRLIRTLASDPVRDGTIDPRYTGQQHPDRYVLGKYKVHQTGTKEIPINVRNHFPKKSHFKAHPAWLQQRS